MLNIQHIASKSPSLINKGNDYGTANKLPFLPFLPSSSVHNALVPFIRLKHIYIYIYIYACIHYLQPAEHVFYGKGKYIRYDEKNHSPSSIFS